MGDLPDGWDMKDFKTIEIPPEHKGSLGDTFKYIQDKVLAETEEERFRQFLEAKGTTLEKEKEKEQNEFMKRLEERKRIYRASGKGIDFNKERTDEEEDERMQNLKTQTEELPSIDVAGVYLPCSYGVDIETEQIFQQELHGIVDEMKVKLVDEKKILEGTLNPVYGKGEWSIPQNELSQSNPLQEQWKSDSPNGSWITDLTPTSTCASSISFSTVEDSSPSFPTILLRRQSISSPDDSWTVKLVASGTEIVVMNESLDSMEQTINVPMVGMLNEVK